MSNPSIVTKLLTLVKGAFGRKDSVPEQVPAGQETREQDTGKSTGAGERENTAEGTVPAGQAGAPAAAEKAADRAEEPAGSPAPAEEAEKKAGEPAGGPSAEGEAQAPAEEPAGTETSVGEQVQALAAEESGRVQDGEPAPATEDVPEKDEAIARELDANEAHTEVASAEVLERVRKEAAPAAEELPVPTYDELTLPSIRARLRKLTIDQVRDLRAYEVAHQSRPEFVKMYDNRIAKLQAEEN